MFAVDRQGGFSVLFAVRLFFDGANLKQMVFKNKICQSVFLCFFEKRFSTLFLSLQISGLGHLSI